MRNGVMMAICAAALAGCATTSTTETAGVEPGAPVAIEADAIRYETLPCHGFCPVYAVTVRPDGSGTFEGMQHTAFAGERQFTLSRQQYDAFAARLAAYRPQSGEVRYDHGEPNCQNAPTDMPGVDVTWTRAAGDSQKLHFYYGCSRENPQMAEALRGAVSELPIGEWIKK